MAHIQVPGGAPGILGPMATSPESTKALREPCNAKPRLVPGEVCVYSLRHRLRACAALLDSLSDQLPAWVRNQSHPVATLFFFHFQGASS